MSRRLRMRCLAAALALAAWPASPAAAQEDVNAGRAADRYSWVGLDYAYTKFLGGLDSWQTAALSAGQRRAAGSLIGRVTWADRFAQHGVQIEADAYPKLGARGYGYLNFGWSGASIFPSWRLGAEADHGLPHAWEASLGVRHLHFDAEPVTLFTGSLQKYMGNDWFSARPWLRFKDGSVSASASLLARRYGVGPDDYVGARVGYGSTPSDDVTATEAQRLRDTNASLQGSRIFGGTTVVTLSLTWEREEVIASQFRTRWEVAAGASRRFR